MGCILSHSPLDEQQLKHEDSICNNNNSDHTGQHSPTLGQLYDCTSKPTLPPLPNDAKNGDTNTCTSILISFDGEINQLERHRIDSGQGSEVESYRGAMRVAVGEMSSREEASLKRKRAADTSSSSSLANRNTKLVSSNGGAQEKRSKTKRGNLLTTFISLLVKRKRLPSARIEAANSSSSIRGQHQHPKQRQQSQDLLCKKSKLEPGWQVGAQMGDQHQIKPGQLTVREARLAPPASGGQVNHKTMRRTPQEANNFANSSPSATVANSQPTFQHQHQQPAQANDEDEVFLFTSVQQLCCEIIGQKLLRHHESESSPKLGPVRISARPANKDDHQRTLCLFVFGRQGSSMGELAFELVEHSPLVAFMRDYQTVVADQQKGHNGGLIQVPRATSGSNTSLDQPIDRVHERECALYHYIDVSALIVANIDQRIREYNRLVARTLRARRQQVGDELEGEDEEDPHGKGKACDESSSRRANDTASNSGTSSQDDQVDGDDDDDESCNGSRLGLAIGGPDSVSLWSREPLREPSIDSEPRDRARASSALGGQSCQQELHHTDQFGMVTLSTRQRSILQLKMIKYATCVTTKWVTLLIHNEISKLETQLKRLETTKAMNGGREQASNELTPPPPRVYLINLVPNQLSLFKTCLYLQQELPLNNFRYRHWAVKFERRTNIKLLTKERGAEPAAHVAGGDLGCPETCRATSMSPQCANHKLFHRLRLPPIGLPAILVARSSSEPSLASKSSELGALSRRSDSPPVGITDEQLQQQRGQQIGVEASNLLANSVNEKLGPKFSENFANQFKLSKRLTLLRYNPTRNYNYATDKSDGSNPMASNEATGQRFDSHTKTSSSSDHHQQDISPSSPPASPSSHSVTSGDFPGERLLPLAIDATPAPSIIVDYDDEQHLRLPTLFDLGHHRASSSSGSLISNESSEQSGAWQHQPSFQLRHSQASPITHSTAHSGSPSVTGPKWAVELELIDALDNDNKWYSRSSGSTDSMAGMNLGASASSLASNQHHATSPLPSQSSMTTTTTTTNCCLHIYRPPAKRSSSRSPLSLVSTGNGSGPGPSGASGSSVQAAHCLTGHYYLVATRVAYANGRSQPILEAKTLHRRTIRYSGPADSLKLAKVIMKALGQLANDLDVWLRTALENPHGASNHLDHHHRQHHTQQQQQQHHSQHQQHQRHHQHGSTGQVVAPLLVTYTIRIDVAKLLRRTSKTSSEHQQSLAAHLASSNAGGSPNGGEGEHCRVLSPSDLAHLLRMQPERPTLSKRPASALAGDSSGSRKQPMPNSRVPSSRLSLQPIANTESSQTARSSLGDCSPLRLTTAGDVSSQTTLTDTTKPRHHVQFKLSQAPQSDDQSDEDSSSSRAQKRIWLQESLFVGYSDNKLSPVVDSFVSDLLKSLAGR